MHLNMCILVYFIHSKKKMCRKRWFLGFLMAPEVWESGEVTKGLGQAGQIPSHKDTLSACITESFTWIYSFNHAISHCDSTSQQYNRRDWRQRQLSAYQSDVITALHINVETTRQCVSSLSPCRWAICCSLLSWGKPRREYTVPVILCVTFPPPKSKTRGQKWKLTSSGIPNSTLFCN